MTQPPYSSEIRFIPAKDPSGLNTRQSPIQKSNWRFSGAAQGADGATGAAWSVEVAITKTRDASSFIGFSRLASHVASASLGFGNIVAINTAPKATAAEPM